MAAVPARHRSLHHRPRRLVALLCLLLGAPLASADARCWRELQFVASNGWIGASSTIRYEAPVASSELAPAPQGEALQPDADRIGKIHATFEALSNTGELDTWYELQSSAVLQSRRLSQGQNSRLKTHRFLRTGVWRERLEPGSPDARDPAQWQARSAALIPYPQSAESGAVLSPVMLVARAAELVRSNGKVRDQLVFTDKQLYHVRLATAPPENLETDFRLIENAKQRRVRGSRTAQRVSVVPRLLGSAPEEEAFSLLELSGDLAIFVDKETALPLRVQGSWLRVGTVPAELARAELRSGCGG